MQSLAATPMPLSISRFVLPALLIPIALLPFLQARHFGIIPVDDPLYLEHPLVAAGPTLEGILWAFTNLESGHWLPLTWLSLMVDRGLFGADWGTMHLVNLGFHAANTLLVMVLLQRLTGATGRAFLVAALFAVHPLRVESVVWLTERKDVLFTLFFLLALLAYQRATARRTAPLGLGPLLPVLGLFLLSLMAKPMAVTLPVVLLLLDHWPLGRLSQGHGPLLREKIPLLLVALGCALATALAYAHSTGGMASLALLPPGDRVAQATISYGAYLKDAVWPLQLAFFHSHPGRNWAGVDLAAAAVLLGVLGGWAWHQRRRGPHLLWGLLWFLITLAPVIGLVQISTQARADRFTYLPLLGLFVAMVWEADRRWPTGTLARRARPLLAAGLILALGLLTQRQTALWQDPELLFRHSLAITGPNPNGLRLVGLALHNQGRWAEASGWYWRSLEADPRDAATHRMTGRAQDLLGRHRRAEYHFRAALRLEPRDPRLHALLARILLKQGRLAASLPHLDRAAAGLPRDAAVHLDLGRTLNRLRRHQEALAPLEQARRLDPAGAVPPFELGYALLKLQRPQEALIHLDAALTRDPGHVAAGRLRAVAAGELPVR
ncbi:MAG: tetratricopeptide repeat protein [Magnetococcales bacterium]|nr:tetratricopeptide repeat protein [Magnetococcales bacterium]